MESIRLVGNLAGENELDSELLYGLSSLKSLQLSHTGLIRIDFRAFAHTPNLTHLDLSYNYQAFQHLVDRMSLKQVGLIHLRHLDLSKCDIERIEDGAFESLAQLEVLILYANKLADLSRHVFRGLVALQTIDLRYNLFHSLPLDVFDDMTNLADALLSGSNLSEEMQNQLSIVYGSSLVF